MSLGGGRRNYTPPMRRLRPKLECIYRIRTRCLKATAKAILVDIPAGPGEPTTWVPLVAVHPTSQVKTFPDEGELVVRIWFAKTKGWVR